MKNFKRGKIKMYIWKAYKNYLFFIKNGDIRVFSLYQFKFLKPYYSTLKKYWRYKLRAKKKPCQFSEKQLIRFVEKFGAKLNER